MRNCLRSFLIPVRIFLPPAQKGDQFSWNSISNVVRKSLLWSDKNIWTTARSQDCFAGLFSARIVFKIFVSSVWRESDHLLILVSRHPVQVLQGGKRTISSIIWWNTIRWFYLNASFETGIGHTGPNTGLRIRLWIRTLQKKVWWKIFRFSKILWKNLSKLWLIIYKWLFLTSCKQRCSKPSCRAC